jgi:hypothetical protein
MADEALADLGLFRGADQSRLILRIAEEDPRLKDYLVSEQGLPEAIYSSIVQLGSHAIDTGADKMMYGVDPGPLEMHQSLHALTHEAARVARMVVKWHMDVTKAVKTLESCSHEARAPLPRKRFLGGIMRSSTGSEEQERSAACCSFGVAVEAMRYDLLETPDAIRDLHLAQMQLRHDTEHVRPSPDAPAPPPPPPGPLGLQGDALGQIMIMIFAGQFVPNGAGGH